MPYRKLAIAAVFGLALCAAPAARGQYYYPYGYGGWGWGGWDYNAGLGSYATGLGWMAAGEGVYNLNTAEANSINVNTAMHLNEYLYQSLMEYDRKRLKVRAKELQDYKDAALIEQNRVRNNPTDVDLFNGDALNSAMTELSDPRYAAFVARDADKIKVPGALIANIPFRNAVEAVTLSLDELTDADQPDIFLGPEFADDVKAYKAITDELNKEAEAGTVNPATVRKMRATLKQVDQKLQAMKDLAPEKRFDAERHLKALMGLSYMLDGPDIDIYLAGIEERNDVTLSKLLGFMQVFNLRFGIAENPEQKQAYQALYPLLVKVRKDIFKEGTGSLPSNTSKPSDRTSAPKNFFGGMSTAELDADANRSKRAGGR